MKKLLTLIMIVLFALPMMAQTPPPMPTKEKQLHLTVFLQGLYNTTNANMNKAFDFPLGLLSEKYPGTIADVITVELHDASNYSNILYTIIADLNQDGSATTGGKTYISIPSSYVGNYRITVKHRNHIETTSSAVSFTDASITYNFTTAANKAYNSNMALLAPNVYGIYVGDVDHDGSATTADRSMVNSALLNGTQGYYDTDVDGDGSVTTSDRSMVNSALLNGVSFVTPTR